MSVRHAADYGETELDGAIACDTVRDMDRFFAAIRLLLDEEPMRAGARP